MSKKICKFCELSEKKCSCETFSAKERPKRIRDKEKKNLLLIIAIATSFLAVEGLVMIVMANFYFVNHGQSGLEPHKPFFKELRTNRSSQYGFQNLNENALSSQMNNLPDIKNNIDGSTVTTMSGDSSLNQDNSSLIPAPLPQQNEVGGLTNNSQNYPNVQPNINPGISGEATAKHPNKVTKLGATVGGNMLSTKDMQKLFNKFALGGSANLTKDEVLKLYNFYLQSGGPKITLKDFEGILSASSPLLSVNNGK